MPRSDSRNIGLARALSKLGYCSRSAASELIRAGHVALNGATRRNPETPTRIECDRITVDGQTVQPARHIYLMMNKPRGLVTTASDEKGRDTIYEILRGEQDPTPWLAPVGRLDKASEGLLLLTNDSEWGARISSPTTHLVKTYHVQIDSIPSKREIQQMECGVNADGDILRALSCHMLRSGEKSCWLEMILDEGKNRHIRRMLAALELSVLRLVRVAIGPLQLGNLAKGSCRPLTIDEKNFLDNEMSADLSRSRRY